jgi:phenylacetic acid degradation protein
VLHVRPDEVTVIGPSYHIGHGVVIDGANLGKHVVVSMHAILHDGVVTGGEALVAAGSVVLANIDILSGKMVVGVPGKIVGDVSEEQMAACGWGTKLCQGLPARCNIGLRRL